MSFDEIYDLTAVYVVRTEVYFDFFVFFCIFFHAIPGVPGTDRQIHLLSTWYFKSVDHLVSVLAGIVRMPLVLKQIILVK